jgi:hypothetical protein
MNEELFREMCEYSGIELFDGEKGDGNIRLLMENAISECLHLFDGDSIHDKYATEIIKSHFGID